MTNQERAKAALPFVQAMAEGKVVEAMTFSDNTHWLVAQFGDLNARLYRAEEMLRIRPEKRRVPLGQGDWDITKDLICLLETPQIWVRPDAIDDEGIRFNEVWQNWETISRECLRSSDGGKTWGPCWKEVEE